MSENTSGIWPVGFSVLVLPDEIEEKTSAGIIKFTPAEADRERLAQVDGVIIALGPNSWCDERTPRAKIGDRVIFAKYAGMVRKGNDERHYRLLNDKDIVAVLS